MVEGSHPMYSQGDAPRGDVVLQELSPPNIVLHLLSKLILPVRVQVHVWREPGPDAPHLHASRARRRRQAARKDRDFSHRGNNWPIRSNHSELGWGRVRDQREMTMDRSHELCECSFNGPIT